MSVLKHNIRHQQAQLQNLEQVAQQRSTWTGQSSSGFDAAFGSPLSTANDLPPPSSFASPQNFKVRKTSSHEVLQSMAGPESMLPLPMKDNVHVIKEGVPTMLGAELSKGRPASPTRSLSSAYTLFFSHRHTERVIDHH